MLDETGDIEKSQGWTALVLDTNGNGVARRVHEPGKPQEPGKDMRIGATFYAVMPSPTDGSVWGTLRGNPGAVVRIDPTKNPHKSLAECNTTSRCPASARAGRHRQAGARVGFGSRAPLGVFDRRLCKGPLNGPKATGDHCPRAGRSTSIRARASRASARTAPRRATTRGSTSTTPSAGDDIPMSTAT